MTGETSSVLDLPDRWASIDRQGMRDVLESSPNQLRSAVEIAGRISVSIPGQIANVVVTGLGGSAIGGDVVSSVAGELLRVPLIVNRDYGLPAFVGPSSLVIACSYSGNTEETLDAFAEARRSGASVFCVTSGGRLAALAREQEIPLVLIPGGLQPRAALGFSTIALLGALRAFGLVPDLTGACQETINLVSTLVDRYHPEIPEASNRAKVLARSLHGRIVVIYGSTGVVNGATVRWRGQMEENAKNLAFHHLLPEMNHNELVGWECPAEILKQLGVIFLRDRGDHPQVQRRFEFTREFIAARAGVVHEVWTEGESRLARIFSVICLADFVSLYLAYLNEVDPTPVEAIEALKHKLGRS
jgi:glucose/mannose-6-phosphate isomerase